MKNSNRNSVSGVNSNKGDSVKLKLDTSKIVTINQVKAKKAFDKRAARAASPVKEEKVKTPKAAKAEEFSSETNEFNGELLTEEATVSEFSGSLPLVVDENNDDNGEFLGADQGFSLTSINEMIEEEEAKTFSKGLLKAYKAQILELYGQEVLDRMEKEEEFKTLILSHMKDLDDKVWSQKPEGDVKITLQYWNVKAGEWYNTTLKYFNIEPAMADGKVFKRYVSFDTIFNEDLSFKMTKTVIKNDAGNSVVIDSPTPVLIEGIEKLFAMTGKTLMLTSTEMEGATRIILSHPRLGEIVGFDSDNETNEEGFPIYKYGELAFDGIYAILPSSFYEKEFSFYEEKDVLADIIIDVSRRISASSAYDLSLSEELSSENKRVKAESKKAKLSAALIEQRREDFLVANKESIDLLKKASSHTEMFGIKAGLDLLKGQDADKLLNVIYSAKLKVNKQVYFAVKNLSNIGKNIRKQTVDSKVAMDVAALINDLNSQHEETRNAAVKRVEACATTARYVYDAACAGNRIFDKGVYFLVKGYAKVA